MEYIRPIDFVGSVEEVSFIGRATAVLAVIFIASAGHAQTLDQQERCAIEAKRSYQDIQARDLAEQKQVGGQRISADYQSHYNTKTGKCLMLVETTDMLGGGTSSTAAYLMDANERTSYASYQLSVDESERQEILGGAADRL